MAYDLPCSKTWPSLPNRPASPKIIPKFHLFSSSLLRPKRRQSRSAYITGRSCPSEDDVAAVVQVDEKEGPHLADTMHAKTCTSRSGRGHRHSRHQSQGNGHQASRFKTTAPHAPSLATLVCLAALVSDVGVGALPAKASNNHNATNVTTRSRYPTPTATPLTRFVSPFQFTGNCGSENIRAVVVVVDDDVDSAAAAQSENRNGDGRRFDRVRDDDKDEMDDGESSNAVVAVVEEKVFEMDALEFVRNAASVVVAEFLCPGYSRSDTNQDQNQDQEEEVKVDPSIILCLSPSPTLHPPSSCTWLPSATTHKNSSPTTSPPPAVADLAAGTLPKTLLPIHLPKSQSPSNQQQNWNRDRLGIDRFSSPSFSRGSSSLAFANTPTPPRPRQQLLRPRSSRSSSSSGGRHLLARRNVPSYDHNIPDRFELGPDGLWYKVTFTTSCPGCPQVCNSTSLFRASPSRPFPSYTTTTTFFLLSFLFVVDINDLLHFFFPLWRTFCHMDIS